MSHSVLLVDDDVGVVSALTFYLEQRGWRVFSAGDGRAGVEAYERDAPDIVVLDLDLPGLSGMQILQVLLARDPDATVLMLTGTVDVSTAVEALHFGAENFLTKPVDLDHFAAAADRALETARLKRRNKFFAQQQGEEGDLSSLRASPAMSAVATQVELLAPGQAPILLTGETGTGKGWLAKLIHSVSPRASAPFVAVNCAGLSATFLDSELFGHEKGAFTDAKTAKQGLFEIADGGTLFLDEVGDLALDLQPKLLTALESQRFRRLGGTREIEVSVRLIAATHHDLAASVRSGRFREDLFYRLAVLPIRLPSLRERGADDITSLAVTLLGDLRRTVARGPSRISVAALRTIARYPWPGNVRELRNTLERALLMAGDAPEVLAEHLPAELRDSLSLPEEDLGADMSLDSAEKRHILRVLAHCDGNRSLAARSLGITRATLYKKLRAYGVEMTDSRVATAQ